MALHTDDPNNEGNLSDEDYMSAWLERIELAGDSGLHQVPDEYLKETTDGEAR